MPASISPDRIIGAVLLVNEVYAAHTENDARKLHHLAWRAYVPETGEHLNQSDFLEDGERSALLIGSLERALDFGNSRSARALTLRFGIVDGQFRTLDQVGKELDPGKILTREEPRKLIAGGIRRLRHPVRNYLRVFYGEKSTADIRAELEALPQPRQRRATRP